MSVDRDRALRALNVLRVVAIADFVLLVVLLYVAWIDRSEAAVSVLGPIHGVGYMIMLVLTARGSGEGWWGWWFPALVLVTLGPLGSLIGDLKVRRQLAQEPAPRA